MALFDTIESLCEACNKALIDLEHHDYRSEVPAIHDRTLDLKLIPQTLKDIRNDVMRHFRPIIDVENNFKEEDLLTKDNINLFIHNTNRNNNRTAAKKFMYLDPDLIKELTNQFQEIGLHDDATLLENAYNFIIGIRNAHCTNQFTNEEAPRIEITYTIQKDELTEDERAKEQRYSDFCRIFAPNIFSSDQRKNLYASFQKILKTEQKPHLLIMTILVLLFSKRKYNYPLQNALGTIRTIVFTSLQQKPDTCKNYGKDALTKGNPKNLLKYKTKAEGIISKI